jgi:hypothetical protein
MVQGLGFDPKHKNRRRKAGREGRREGEVFNHLL